jgi:C4-dicarboxylate transporter DctM subunit
MSNVAFVFIIMFAGLLFSVPIGISLGTATVLAILCYSTTPSYIVIQNIFGGLNSFSLLAIPFFMIAGSLMGLGGISKRIVKFADALVGWITGGLGMVVVLASMIFAAISGSAPATVSSIGSMLLPQMEEKNYDKDFSTALVASAGTIGVIIPPSIPFVMYCIVASQSVGTIFIAGIIPGLLIGLALMTVCYFISKKHGYVASYTKKDRPKFWPVFRECIWAILSPVIILGSIYSGLCTPTEAAVISIFYSAVVGIFIYRETTFKIIIESLRSAGELNGQGNLAVGLSMAFATYLTTAGIPKKIGAWITGAIHSDVLILLAILGILLLVGCFVDNISSCLVLTPIFLPIVTSIGMDPIHFGVVMTVALAIGFCTPPFGSNLFIAAAISGLPIESIVRRIWPMIIAMAVCLLLITFIPQLSLFLVSLM